MNAFGGQPPQSSSSGGQRPPHLSSSGVQWCPEGGCLVRYELLRQAKERKGLSYRQLAQQTGLSFTYIQQVLSGTRRPSISALVRLCTSLEVDPGAVIADELQATGAESA